MNKIYYKKDSGLLCNRYPSNLEIEEGDPYIEVSDDDLLISLSTEGTKVWKVINGSLQNVDDTSTEAEEERKTIESQNKISELENWFTTYDLQVSQYLRSTRMNKEIVIHIGDKTYTTIDDLDKEAEEKAEELNTLRNELQAS